MKVALVTGAGSGIGRAVARALAREGWTLALLGRREAPLQETLPEALHLPADVTDEAQVDAAFQTLRQRFGRLDLLFNNAGISALGVPIDELSVAQWRAVVDTNLTGSFLCARAAFALMKAQLPRGSPSR
jgi:NAD(P)-dependent dehydrogenase (short-subunit alcohol dehydrogenase family)